jgi:hypothetical protein
MGLRDGRRSVLALYGISLVSLEYREEDGEHTNTAVVSCELELLKHDLVAVLLQFLWTIRSLQ